MIKKIEIVFPKSFLPELTKILEDLKLPGYTILEVYSSFGPGHGASNSHLGFSSSQTNLYLFSVCETSMAERIIAILSRPIHQIGGLLAKSDIAVY